MLEPDNTAKAFAFYQRIRSRLPVASFSGHSQEASSLLAIAGQFDVFVFDAFGVLNVGQTVIPGAAELVSTLRSRGKRVFVLTNGATLALDNYVAKLRDMGFDFSVSEVISSRQAAEAAIQAEPYQGLNWGVISAGVENSYHGLAKTTVLEDDADTYHNMDAFLFLSSRHWNENRQRLLEQTLHRHPRPVVIANPDVVAPFEGGFSLEPGFYAHRLMDQGLSDVFFFGKPFPDVYQMLQAQIEPLDPGRVLMLGDTLHTDVLGAATAGWRSALVTGHGLFTGHDTAQFIAQSGMVPDFVMPSIVATERGVDHSEASRG